MISRLIERFIQEDAAWDSYVEILAALPGNF